MQISFFINVKENNADVELSDCLCFSFENIILIFSISNFFIGFTTVLIKKQIFLNSYDELQTRSLVIANQILVVDNRASFTLAIIVQAPIIFSAQEQIHSD